MLSPFADESDPRALLQPLLTLSSSSLAGAVGKPTAAAAAAALSPPRDEALRTLQVRLRPANGCRLRGLVVCVLV